MFDPELLAMDGHARACQQLQGHKRASLAQPIADKFMVFEGRRSSCMKCVPQCTHVLADRAPVQWQQSICADWRSAASPGTEDLDEITSPGSKNDFNQRRCRQFAAWIGLVPQQHKSGGKSRMLDISKRGDAYLRTLLIHGALGLDRGRMQ